MTFLAPATSRAAGLVAHALYVEYKTSIIAPWFLITYMLASAAFALVYYFAGLPNEHATALLLQKVAEVYRMSLTALHGRTFFEQFGIGSTLARVAAACQLRPQKRHTKLPYTRRGASASVR